MLLIKFKIKIIEGFFIIYFKNDNYLKKKYLIFEKIIYFKIINFLLIF